MKINKYILLETRKKVLQRDAFTCQKCGFQDLSSEELELHHVNPKIFGGENFEENLVTLCSICHNYAPDSEKLFLKYLDEKIDGKILNTFRKSQFSIAKKTKQGMANKFNQGIHITKAPKGYKLINKQLVIDKEQAEQVKKAYEQFVDNNISLTQLAKKNNMTTTGIKKLLKNTTYIGKVKFANQESRGQHEPLIMTELFNKVQSKMGNLGIK